MNLESIANNTILPSKGEWKLRHEDGDTDDIISTVLYADKLADKYTKDLGKKIRLKSIQDFKKLWQFVRRNIRYVEDGDVQVIQSPAELWRTKVGDCKSFSVFIKSICSNAGFKGGYRFVRYGSDEFVTHVYPWVLFNGRKIYLDAVKGAQFNHDDYYSEKFDYAWNTGAKIGMFQNLQNLDQVIQSPTGQVSTGPVSTVESPTDQGTFQWTPLKVAVAGLAGYFLIKRVLL